MQEWRADAAPGDSDATWVAVEPCRLFDYRPGEEPSDGKKTPLAAGTPATQQVTGNIGNCSIPTVGVVAVSMNVTVVQGTAQSNLRLYPADAATEPVVSNLNWKAGDSATANKVDVKLSSTGALKLANFSGNVNVIGDVVGYYTNTSLKELAAEIATLKNAQPFAVTDGDGFKNIGTTDETVVSVNVAAPVAGQVTVMSTTALSDNVAGNEVRCSITTGATLDTDALQRWESGGPNTGQHASLAGVRTFDIEANATMTYNLVCDHVGAGTALLSATYVSAIFTPTP